MTTVYLGGVYEEDVQTGEQRMHYQFNGAVIAQRTNAGSRDELIYLYGDHLGSVSAATTESGALLNRQNYDPWGAVRAGGISQTTLNYTGQQRDSTGLLYYHARYYDPVLGRFLSADSIVPDTAHTSLTVDFHEPGFVGELNGENGQPFWFQSSKKQVAPWGPANAQALNRYTYVNNNPILSVDPTGHFAAAVLGAAFTGIGVTLSAPAIGAILAAVSLYIVLACLSSPGCRDAVLDTINAGISSLKNFADNVANLADNDYTGPTISGALDSVSSGYLKRKGIDAHEVKRAAWGRKADLDLYDIYVDDDGQVWTKRRGEADSNAQYVGASLDDVGEDYPQQKRKDNPRSPRAE